MSREQYSQLKDILKADTIEKEHLLLEKLLHDLNPGVSDDIESAFLQGLSEDGVITAPIETNITNIFTEQTQLNEFIKYIYCRRYGWSDAEDCGKASSSAKDATSKSSRANLALRNQMNEKLDTIVSWVMSQEISSALVSAYSYTLCEANKMPIVRNQTVIHIAAWVNGSIAKISESDFNSVSDLLIQGLTDIWSAVRKACSSRLGPIIEALPLLQLEMFFTSLTKVCQDSSSTWQAKEGSLLGISTVLRKLQWVSVVSAVQSSPELHDISSPRMNYFLVVGEKELPGMPIYISSVLPTVVYELLAHPQLTVREQAVKVFTTFISKCDAKVAATSLDEVVERLSRGYNKQKMTNLNELVMEEGFTFLDPYEAEGLLGVCVHLIKTIPAESLLFKWSRYFSTFSLYLMHPASTVRQATSSIFKFIVAKNSSDPLILKNTLEGLSKDWVVDDTLLNNDVYQNDVGIYSHTQHGVTFSGNRVSVNKIVSAKTGGKSVQDSWEWREGRLLAYELILQFLIKNHWLYTFGSAGLIHPAAEESEPTPVHCGSPKQSGIHPYLPEDTEHGAKNLMINHLRGRFRVRTRSFNEYPDRPNTKSSTEGSHPIKRPSKSVTSTRKLMDYVSTFRCFLFECRTPTIGATHSSHTHKTMGRHYTYYNTPGSDTTGARSPRGQESDVGKACSLLRACYQMENGTSSTNSGSEDSSQGESVNGLLQRIFYQCVESLADKQWELRRMGGQLLPCIVEVIRWFDVTILEDLLDNHLCCESKLLTYGLCLSLLYSVSHAAKLKHLLDHPPTSWQYPGRCMKVIRQITVPLSDKIQIWSCLVHQLLQRPVYDKITIIATEVLMLVHSHFHLEVDKKYAQLNRVLTVLKCIYMKAHPATQYGAHLSDAQTFQKRVLTPKDGFLSCCTRCDGTEHSQALQVEKAMLSQIQGVLGRFVHHAYTRETAVLLPILCTYLTTYREDDQLIKHIYDSICVLSHCCTKLRHNEDSVSSQKEAVKSLCIQALDELATVISEKDLDLASLKQALELYAHISTSIPVQDHIQRLAAAVGTKVYSPAGGASAHDSGSESDLALQNDGLVPPLQDDADSSSEGEEENIDMLADGHLIESQTLDTSANSCGSNSSGLFKPSHRRVPSSTQADVIEDESEESDWDSVEDDDVKDHSAVTAALTDFLIKVLKNNKSSPGDTAGVLDTLNTKDKKVIESLLHEAV